MLHDIIATVELNYIIVISQHCSTVAGDSRATCPLSCMNLIKQLKQIMS